MTTTVDVEQFRRLIEAAKKATKENDPLVSARDSELKTFMYENAEAILAALSDSVPVTYETRCGEALVSLAGVLAAGSDARRQWAKETLPTCLDSDARESDRLRAFVKRNTFAEETTGAALEAVDVARNVTAQLTESRAEVERLRAALDASARESVGLEDKLTAEKRAREEAEGKLAGLVDELKLFTAERDEAQSNLFLVHAPAANVWHWQGDGEDRPETMAAGLPVVMRVETLRAMLARADEAERDRDAWKAKANDPRRAWLVLLLSQSERRDAMRECEKEGLTSWTPETGYVLTDKGRAALTPGESGKGGE